jgi:NAD-dependent deacetylase
MPSLPPLNLLSARLRSASAVTVLTGAGVSAASGVPTFRGPDGLWKHFRPEQLATPHAFARDPRLVWEWYDWRRQRIAGCAPNAAHVALAEWSRRLPRFTLVTQNVDGLHERARTQNVVRLHGSIWELRHAERDRATCPDLWRDETVPLGAIPACCPRCGGLARPAVVWFGEPLDSNVLRAAEAATSCDLFLVVGTASVVYPAAGLAETARRRGAFTVEINPDDTEASSAVDLAVRGRAEDVLPALSIG